MTYPRSHDYKVGRLCGQQHLGSSRPCLAESLRPVSYQLVLSGLPALFTLLRCGHRASCSAFSQKALICIAGGWVQGKFKKAQNPAIDRESSLSPGLSTPCGVRRLLEDSLEQPGSLGWLMEIHASLIYWLLLASSPSRSFQASLMSSSLFMDGQLVAGGLGLKPPP